MGKIEFRAGNMHKFIPAAAIGNAKIVHDSPDVLTRLRAARDGQPLDCDVYTRLIANGCLWMTDADFEWRTNVSAVNNAYGEVLIAGLGIGFMIRPILLLTNVSSVTVIEVNPDIIKLVAPHLKSDKLEILESDARTWEPPKKRFDFIYLDIWPNVPNEDDIQDIKDLKKHYRPALKKGDWIKAWCEEFARKD